ncbi:MAG: 2-isopropylmalate synthase [Gemmatimonadetes bacterium]|nr:2-isopropylmalate synthase [Gemmatimonadota bacterium]
MKDLVQELIYDWNVAIEPPPPAPVALDDETLRDGQQSPSCATFSIETKIKLLHLMDQLQIDIADLGLPGAGKAVADDVRILAREIVEAKLSIAADCAARTVIADIEPVARISQEVGLPIEVSTFIGSSPIRMFAEGWNLDLLLRRTEEAVSFAVKEGLSVMFVTEDTTRAAPADVEALYRTAINCGARRICVCDTVGHVTPAGVRALIGHVKRIVFDSGEDVAIDWHGHRDRGLALPNSLAALEAGADRLHGTALGIGERAGNTEMDLLLVNLRLLRYIDRDLTALAEYCETVAEASGIPLPINYPVAGDDAFRTGTGVHAAAIIKAEDKGDADLADCVYSGVPAHWFGRSQTIEIGPMSGESNVIYWLEKRGYDVTRERIDRVFQAAKRSRNSLSSDRIRALVEES